MLEEVPGRMLAPMLVLEAAGPVRSKVRLRLLTLLAQHELRDGRRPAHEQQRGAYTLEARRYGPRCDLLDRDMSCSPHLVEHRIIPPSAGVSRASHYYGITRQGRSSLGRMRPGMDQGMLGAAEGRIKALSGGVPAALLDEAYALFGPAAGTPELEDAVAADLARAGPPIRRAYEGLVSRQAVAAAEILETVGAVLSWARVAGIGDAQRRVILCMSGDAICGCEGLGKDPASANMQDSPCLADVDDLVSCMAQYCEGMGAAGDPMRRPLRDVLGVDEARALCVKMRET